MLNEKFVIVAYSMAQSGSGDRCRLLSRRRFSFERIQKIIQSVYKPNKPLCVQRAELAQSAERTTLNRVVEGSIPSFGVFCWIPPFSFSSCYRGGCDQKHHSITQLHHAIT